MRFHRINDSRAYYSCKANFGTKQPIYFGKLISLCEQLHKLVFKHQTNLRKDIRTQVPNKCKSLRCSSGQILENLSFPILSNRFQCTGALGGQKYHSQMIITALVRTVTARVINLTKKISEMKYCGFFVLSTVTNKLSS